MPRPATVIGAKASQGHAPHATAKSRARSRSRPTLRSPVRTPTEPGTHAGAAAMEARARLREMADAARARRHPPTTPPGALALAPPQSYGGSSSSGSADASVVMPAKQAQLLYTSLDRAHTSLTNCKKIAEGLARQLEEEALVVHRAKLALKEICLTTGGLICSEAGVPREPRW